MPNYEIQIQVTIRETDADVSPAAQQSVDGSFRTVVSGVSGQNIDACEQAVLAVNYPALREALSRHFSEVAHQEASRGRVGLVKKTPRPTRSMAKSGGGALPRTVV